MHLIYYSISNNINYLNLLDKSIHTLLEFGNFNGEFAFITNNNSEWLNELFKLSSLKDVKFHIIDNNNDNDLKSSSFNKFLIFKMSNLDRYESILMLDCDIICLKDINPIFLLAKEDKLTISTEKEYMGEVHWGYELFTLEEREFCKQNNLHGCNGGSFLFKPSFKDHFEEMYKLISSEVKYRNFQCIEQPLLNYYLFKNNLFDTSLSKYVSNYGYHSNPLHEEKTLLHFAGGPGNYEHKIKKINNFLSLFRNKNN